MLSKTLILAVAATGLMAGAAFAQDASSSYPNKATTPPDQIQNSPFSPNAVNPTPVPNDITPAPTGAQTNTSATVPDSSSAPTTVVTNTLVTNGPVPDTAANRAKYGAPESHAGKLTRPAGN